MNEMDAGLTIFTGRFGSGKTETALNYAVLRAGSRQPDDRAGEAIDRKEECRLRHARSTFGPEASAARPPASLGQHPILIDLDIVTPYFRSREMADSLRDRGVEVIAPAVISQHLDTPAITPQILGAVQQLDRPVILDVGGDQQGARALGQYSSTIRKRRHVVHFVVNPYRPFTDTLSGLAQSIAEIESSSRLKVNSLVSNPNLMSETTAATISEGHAQIEEYARELGLPIAFLCVEQQRAAQLRTSHAGPTPLAVPVLPLQRNFVMAWE